MPLSARRPHERASSAFDPGRRQLVERAEPSHHVRLCPVRTNKYG
jgi:hypothetical protein